MNSSLTPISCLRPLLVPLACGLVWLSVAERSSAESSASANSAMASATQRRVAPMKEGETRMAGRYLLNNNVWGKEKSPAGWQAIGEIGTEDLLSWSVHYNWPIGLDRNSVKAYPSVVTGWQWGVWSADHRLPVAVSRLEKLVSGAEVAIDKPGVQNLAYDLWFHAATPVRSDDKPSDELMIWMGRFGGAGPLGKLQEKVQIDGATWSLYYGDIGWKVFSFVREENAGVWRVNAKAFIDHLVSRGLMREDKQLSSVQFGSEVFSSPGEARLNVSSYFVDIEKRLESEHVSSAATPNIPYAPLQILSADDSEQTRLEKAAKVLPRPNQSAWMRLERTFFLHFGPNTFRGVEWGSGRESPSLFNPAAFDADQWVTAVANAGGKLLILVAKHHDGLCLWPSRYTDHSVASSPWLGGKGDEVRAVAEACRKHGIKLGIYLSPADLYQLRTNPTNPAGLYGNGSPKVHSVIPTDPATFIKDPSRGRPPTPGVATFAYEVDDYNRYFLNQLYELLTDYGPISVAWFDGANPDPSVHETYDYAAWYDLIRHLQPDAVISVKGPDVRWVGNESGVGRTSEWSVIPLTAAPERFTWPDMQAANLGGREKLVPGSYLWWYPAEVNTPILNGWFWSAEKHTKSLAEMVDYYYRSIGRNGNMLLNLSPDTRGLVPDDQVAVLGRMARVLGDTFARDLAEGAQFGADDSATDNAPALAHDGNLDTWWEAAPGNTSAMFTLTLPAAVTFDVVSLQEAIEHRGQRIEAFEIETWNGTSWAAAASAEEETTVGHKRLVRLLTPVTTDRVRIHITKSRLEPTLAEVGLFKQSLPGAPAISERSREGFVSLSHPHSLPILYTLDGTEPTESSAVYAGPISLPRGGVIQSALHLPDGRMGLSSSKVFVGLSPTGWKVVNVDGVADGAGALAGQAIDADAKSLWTAHRAPGAGRYPSITVDMGNVQRIGGFAYLPRQDWVFAGVVDRYRFETSVDGRQWTTQVAAGEFGNIRNNPMLQEVRFAPVSARLFRFTALRDVENTDTAGVAELTVLAASADESK